MSAYRQNARPTAEVIPFTRCRRCIRFWKMIGTHKYTCADCDLARFVALTREVERETDAWVNALLVGLVAVFFVFALIIR